MKKTAAFIFTLFLTGCATPYQPLGMMGGYSDLQINQNTIEVSAQGNDATSQGEVEKIILRRSAELTLSQNYKYFIILNKKIKKQSQTVQISAPSTFTTGQTTTQKNHTTSTERTVYDPGQTVNDTTYTETYRIQMTQENGPTVYDAKMIMQQTDDLVNQKSFI